MSGQRGDAAMARIWCYAVAATALCFLLLQPGSACAADLPRNRLVVVLFPEAANGSPGNLLADRGIRTVFDSQSREQIEIQNEYLEVSRFSDAEYQEELTAFLRRKYAGRKVDLLIAGLSSALDFTVRHREQAFPNVPVVFLAVDEQEVKDRQLESDIVGAPIRMDLAESLRVALQLHPQTEQVFVIAGKSKYDAYWEAEARQRFRGLSEKVKLTYLTGLPLAELLSRVKKLPNRSIVYYLHVFEDGDGKVYMPAQVLAEVSAVCPVPIYSHVDSYIGRGIVGGHVWSFEAAGRRAAEIGLRIFAGEPPQKIGIQPTIENQFVFDGRQLKRWGISESRLPADSAVRFQQRSVWDRYKWHAMALIAFLVLQAALIVRLAVQKFRLARAKRESLETQYELQDLTGKLYVAQETERRRIASELHDDFGQSLALLSVEIDLLRRKPAESNGKSESLIDAMSAQVKQLSASIHDLSHQLHPLKLEQLGLVAALGSLCNGLNRTEVLQVDFVHDDVPASLPQPAAVCLYRIAQEALQNVIKHSGARHAVVELQGANGEMFLRVQDDGKGFDAGKASGQGGLGLVGMRERLRAVGGAVVVTAQSEQGTRIEVRIPRDGDEGSNGERRRQVATSKRVSPARELAEEAL